MTKRLLGAVAGIALTAALVAGCGPAPGAAATVDGDVIGQDEVAAVVAELNPLFADPTLPEAQQYQMTPAQAVAQLVSAPTVLGVAADAGYGVSEDDARAALLELAAAREVEPLDEYSEATVLVARYQITVNGLNQDPAGADLVAEIGEQVLALDVDLNPRYGTWDGQAIVPATYEWIATPQSDDA